MRGVSTRPWNEHAPHFARRLAALARAGFQGKLAAADGRVIHNSGGSEAQELAFAVSVALAYLRALEAEGVALEAARRMIFFRLSADADQFLTIAKFRALRKLWARVEVSCGLAAEPCFHLCRNRMAHDGAARSPREHFARDHRAFAAALGGADAITVLPFTAARGLPDRFARRIARNTQLLLSEESHLDKVADPAAGSGAVENLTDELCRAAWALFQEIEAAGGIAAALETGLIQSKVSAVRAERAAAAARRKDALTGVSIFPNLTEADAPGRSAGSVDQTVRQAGCSRSALPSRSKRCATHPTVCSAKTGTRPKIFLANLGTPAEFTARTTFAQNFFEAGGIEAVDDDSVDAGALASAFQGLRSSACLSLLRRQGLRKTSSRSGARA